MAERLKTLCNRDCPDVCSIVATVEDGRVTRIQGDKDHPITQGFLCERTSKFLDRQYSPERLLTPLMRKDGVLEPASWDEALDFVAEKLVAIRHESGPAAIFHYRSAGTMGLVNSVTSYFFEQFGPVTDRTGDICSGAGEWAQTTDFGDFECADPSDLLNARQIIVWGRNVYVSWTHLIPVLREARARGAGIVLVDPVHHRTSELCDRFVQPRPGGDFALAMATARLLFERGWTDPDAARWCDHLEAFRALAYSKPVEAWCGEADVSADAAEDLARRLHDRPATILVGWGLGRRLNGAGIVRALDALGAITGNIGVPGGSVAFEAKRRRPFDLSFIADSAPRRIMEPQLGEQILAASDPPIRAVWITAANPVAMLPDSARTAHALETRELVVVADSFLTDTAERAHVVFPTTTLLENDDVLGSYGHHHVGVSRPVARRPEGVRSDLEIIQALAARVGLADVVAGDARSWKRRLLKKLEPHGITLERLEEEGPIRHPFVTPIAFPERAFPTPSGRANLMTEVPASPAVPTAEFPLFLMSLSTEKAQASQWSRPLVGPVPVTVHPDAAAGIADGATARLESSIASITVRVVHDPLQRRDVALVPKGGRFKAGQCVNALIRARLSDHGGGAALSDELVRLVPL
ncbi:MAG: molybdopterin-dependent oxidoreductase [Deltaproteobacteria bacterium]|nr:molybdopterin-dependent oxidoreductase [Deltaproteobacteria bacterium]